MVLSDAKAEKAFVECFDCRFPYGDPLASTLISQGWSISLNAAFCVLAEICHLPRNIDIDRDRLKQLVDEWAAGPDHPIKAPVLHAVHALVDGNTLPLDECVDLMNYVAGFDGQRAALAIIYYATDADKPESDEMLGRIHAEILQRWDMKGV
jgi:hypothetical protein